jgi:hypothetical protein
MRAAPRPNTSTTAMLNSMFDMFSTAEDYAAGTTRAGVSSFTHGRRFRGQWVAAADAT